MIGNDIIDLAQAKQDSNWQRRGFLNKIFTAHEQELIHTATDPEKTVWLLWSLKESVYKLAIRRTGKRVFAPTKIACCLSEPNAESQAGTVMYEGEYQTRSLINAHYIATVAFADGPVPAYTQVIVPYENAGYSTQHQVIRQKIKQHCATLLGVAEHTLSIQKNEAGIPELTVGKSTPMALTISHHGRYGAYCLTPINSF